MSQMLSIQELRKKHEEEEEIRRLEWNERKMQEDDVLDQIQQDKDAKLLEYFNRIGIPHAERGYYTYEQVFGPHPAEKELLLEGGRRIYETEFSSRPKKVLVTDLGDPVEEF